MYGSGVAVKAKVSHYAVTLDAEGRVSAEGAAPLDAPPEWTPEHLLLAALARCCIGSLAYHCKRRSIAFSGSAETAGSITQRDDGSWGFVEIECRAEVELDPAPEGEELRELLERAQRGCFIGGSIRPAPAYRWRVNGADV